jgi:hypothetical protein
VRAEKLRDTFSLSLNKGAIRGQLWAFVAPELYLTDSIASSTIFRTPTHDSPTWLDHELEIEKQVVRKQRNPSTMPVALRPLKLPQMVEEQKARESLEMERSLSQSATSFHTHTSSSTDMSAPSTPVFSIRGHGRLPSSTSSVDVTSQPAPTSSPSSPTLPSLTETIKSPKRSLPDVEEEPQEKDEDYQMLDAPHDFPTCQCCKSCDGFESLCSPSR